MKQRRHVFHSLLHAIHVSASSGLAFIALTALVWSYVLSPAWLQPVDASGYGFFAPSSFWNQRVPRYPTLHPQSEMLVASLVSQVASGGAVFDTASSAAVYTVDASVVPVPVVPSDCEGTAHHATLASEWQAVPIPFYAQPGGGSNQRMIIYQTSSGTLWEFENAYQSAGQWYACRGGKIDTASASNGTISSGQDSLGSGLSLLGGQVSVKDIQRGTIGHVMGLSLPSVSSAVSWPATGISGSGGSLPTGVRLQLDPQLDLSSLGLSPIARLVAETAQTYGFVVWGTADSIAVYGENPASFTSRGAQNPYAALGSSSLAGFPWEALRVLPMDYGQHGQSPLITSFTVSGSTIAAGEMPRFSWEANNVDECVIPGVVSNGGATGSVVGMNLHSDSQYTLTCSGPWGSTSKSVSVSVTGLPSNDPIPALSTTTISSPLSGRAVPLTFLGSDWARETVQKVAYYERQTFLMTSVAAPFELDTQLLPDGPHVLGVTVFFRDGHKEEHTVTVSIRNDRESVPASGPLSQSTPSEMRPIMLLSMSVGLFLVMFAGFVYGWRLVHPRPPKQPLSWLISYR